MDSFPEDAANTPVNFYGSALDSNEEDNEEDVDVTTEVRRYFNMAIARGRCIDLIIVSSQLLNCFFLFPGIENERVTCICSGQCARQRGKGACPCKAADLNCVDVCKCVESKCNKKLFLRKKLCFVSGKIFKV